MIGSEDCGVGGHVESIGFGVVGNSSFGGDFDSVVLEVVESCRHGGFSHMSMLQNDIEDRRSLLQT